MKNKVLKIAITSNAQKFAGKNRVSVAIRGSGALPSSI